MARILVTGGAGYIGSHIMWALKEAGHEPVALDNMTTGHYDNIGGLPLITQDYSELVGEGAALLFHTDAVVHCAALTSAPGSVDDPGLYYAENVHKMAQLLGAVKAAGIPMVFSSSAAVYGPALHPDRVAEDHFTDPPNPYGDTKLIGEKMLQRWSIPHVSLRYFNVAGADPHGRCGPRGDPGTLFSNIMKAGREGTTVNMHLAGGRDQMPGVLYPVRDFIHPTDLAHAHVKALDYLLQGAELNCPLNVGTGMGHNVMEVFQEFRKKFPDLQGEIYKQRPGDPAYVVADADKIWHTMGWRSTNLSSLSQMIETAWQWDRHLHG